MKSTGRAVSPISGGPQLHIVTATHRAVVDIYAAWRAEIAERDWASVHTSGDRRQPLDIADKRGGSWRE